MLKTRPFAVLCALSAGFAFAPNVNAQSGMAVAVNPTTNTIYVSNANAELVDVINGSTNEITTTLFNGDTPGAITVNPTTNTVYIHDADIVDGDIISDNIYGVDGSSNQVVSQCASLWGGPVVDPSTNLLYVNWYQDGTGYIDAINPSTCTVESATTLPDGDEPGSFSINPTTNTLYATDANHLQYVDAVNLSTSAVTPIYVAGDGACATAVNQVTNIIYSDFCNGRELEQIIGSLNGVTAPPIGLSGETQGIAVNTATNTVYVSMSNGEYTDGTVAVVNGATWKLTGYITVGITDCNYPIGSTCQNIAVNPTTNMIYVTSEYSDTLSVINGVTNTVVATITL